MPNVRQFLFPYGMQKNEDGSWTFFNRKYNPVGHVDSSPSEWTEWNVPEHKIFLKGLTKQKRAQLDHKNGGTDDRIYFYDDGSNPELSKSNLDAYLNRLAILIGLQEK